ncbi:hypothetical protein LIER_07702 [Lithospermum erythrorhizon]|uniref:Retrovirus-related Pol polyprotein from transposon TNT 1-94-like beta-barrel domain-containing protein n=1 Tax=Lithospermum erythrorhizon TaxID=34254 RepID=A0AAV3PA43_LITER
MYICGIFNHEALDCNDHFNHAFTSTKLHKSLVAMHIEDSNDVVWYPDSGTSAHITGNMSLLHSVTPYSGSIKVMVGNGDLLQVTHTGQTTISNLKVLNVLFVPSLMKNLLSIQKLCADNSCFVLFSHSNFLVKDQMNMKSLLSSPNQGSLYPIKASSFFSTCFQFNPFQSLASKARASK